MARDLAAGLVQKRTLTPCPPWQSIDSANAYSTYRRDNASSLIVARVCVWIDLPGKSGGQHTLHLLSSRPFRICSWCGLHTKRQPHAPELGTQPSSSIRTYADSLVTHTMRLHKFHRCSGEITYFSLDVIIVSAHPFLDRGRLALRCKPERPAKMQQLD